MEQEANDKSLNWYQQGDVLIKPIDKIPDHAKPVEGLVLAEGEATGHKHQAIAIDVQLFVFDGTTYMRVPRETEIVHEEHLPIYIPAGDYTIGTVREYDHFAEESRPIVD